MNIIEEMAKLIVAKAKSMADIDGAEVNPFYLYSAHGFMTGGFEQSFQLAQNWVENARSGQIPPELQPESAVSASDNEVSSSSVDGGNQTASLSAESGSDGVIPESGLVIDATGPEIQITEQPALTTEALPEVPSVEPVVTVPDAATAESQPSAV